MINLPGAAENVEHIATAKRRPNEDAFNANSRPVGGINGEEDKWLFFNPELAKKTDIVFATTCYGIYLWIKTPAKGIFKKPTIDEKPAAFRSARQFEDEYPWWDHNTIWKAIGRGEKKLKGQLVVDRKRKPMHFAMGKKLMVMHRYKDGFLGFLRSDAIKYGAWPSVILANLRHQITEFEESLRKGGDPLVDEEGNVYGELSPTKLTKVMPDKDGVERSILPISRDRAIDAIAVLKTEGAIISHPIRDGWYRVPKQGEIINLEQKRSVGKGDITVGKGDKTVGKQDRKIVLVPCNAHIDSDLHGENETLDRNVNSNEDRKCLNTPTFPLRSNVEVKDPCVSSGAKNLLAIVEGDLARQKNNPIPAFDINDYAVYEVLDYDKVRFIGYEFPYEWQPVDPYTGKVYSRAEEIKNAIAQLIMDFRMMGWKYTKDEIEALRQLFLDQPNLGYAHVSALVNFTSPQNDPFIIVAKPYNGKGHDEWYWARRIRSLKQFLRYLPQLVREYHADGLEEPYKTVCGNDGRPMPVFGDDGRPIIDFSELESPLLELAFVRDEVDWDDSKITIPTTYRREGDCIVTTYGHQGEVITEKTPIKNGRCYYERYKEYRGAGDVLENPVPWN